MQQRPAEAAAEVVRPLGRTMGRSCKNAIVGGRKCKNAIVGGLCSSTCWGPGQDLVSCLATLHMQGVLRRRSCFTGKRGLIAMWNMLKGVSRQCQTGGRPQNPELQGSPLHHAHAPPFACTCALPEQQGHQPYMGARRPSARLFTQILATPSSPSQRVMLKKHPIAPL